MTLSLFDILILSLIAIAFVAAIIYLVQHRNQSCCESGCDNCSKCGHCKQQKGKSNE